MSDQARKVVRQLTGWRALKVLIYLTLGMVTGCFGPPTMHYDIQEYNKEALDAEEQMLLFNIGELHYQQPPHFMMLSSIAQSRTFSASAGFQWTDLWSSLFVIPGRAAKGMVSSPSVTPKGTDTWQAGPFTAGATESPIFQFLPLQGQDFAQRFESSLTDKFVLFLEDQRWSSRASDKVALVTLFAQSLDLTHGEANGGPCTPGLLRNDSYTTFAECVQEIVGSQPYYVLIDSGYPVPTTKSIPPLGADVVAALQAGYEWKEIGDKFVLTRPVRIPAWFDYSPNFASRPEPNPKSDEPLPPVWSSEPDPTKPPDWAENTGYYLPKGYAWKVYRVHLDPRRSAQRVYALVPDGYDLERDGHGTLRRDAKGNYIPVKPREAAATHVAIGARTKDSPIITATRGIVAGDVGSGIVGTGIPSGTTILAVNATTRTALMSDKADHDSEAPMSIGDVDQFSYADEVVKDVWPVPQDYFYVELRKGEVDGAAAARLCHSQTDNVDRANNVVCGYLKIGNLLQIMQRLADMACPYPSQDQTDIARYCSQSVFGIGTSVPSWAENSAPYRHLVGPSKLQTESIWVPAHNPLVRPDLAERDRVAFFTLYKLYQTALVNTSSLVTGAYPITIPSH
jgi:hypothetical protein